MSGGVELSSVCRSDPVVEDVVEPRALLTLDLISVAFLAASRPACCMAVARESLAVLDVVFDSGAGSVKGAGFAKGVPVLMVEGGIDGDSARSEVAGLEDVFKVEAAEMLVAVESKERCC